MVLVAVPVTLEVPVGRNCRDSDHISEAAGNTTPIGSGSLPCHPLSDGDLKRCTSKSAAPGDHSPRVPECGLGLCKKGTGFFRLGNTP